MISTAHRLDSDVRRRRKVAHPRTPAEILVQNLLIMLFVVAAPLVVVVPIVKNLRPARSRIGQALENGTASVCVVGGGGWRSMWFPSADAYPARVFDACTMNDFRNIEQNPCIHQCYYQHHKDDSRRKRALFDPAALPSGSVPAVGDQQTVGNGDDEQQKKALFDEAGQHLWKTLMDEIERARLSLAVSQSQMRKAALPEKQQKQDLVASTTALPYVEKQHKHMKAAAGEQQQSATLFRHDFKRAAAIFRSRRSNSPECLSCFIDVVQHFNKCT